MFRSGPSGCPDVPPGAPGMQSDFQDYGDDPRMRELATESIFHEGHHLTPEPSPDPWQLLTKDRPNPEIRLFYNIFASAYEKLMKSRHYEAPEAIAKYLRDDLQLDPNCSILDLGCGTGLSGEALTQYGFTNIEGADISEEMIRMLRRFKICYTNHYLVNVTPKSNFTFQSHLYDCVVMVGALMPGHITPECIPNIIGRLLVSGGYLVWISPSLDHMAMKGKDFQEPRFMGFIKQACDAGASVICRLGNINFMDGIQAELYVLQKC